MWAVLREGLTEQRFGGVQGSKPGRLVEEVLQREQRCKPLSVVAIEALRRSTEPKGAAAIVSSRRAVVGRSVRPCRARTRRLQLLL